MQHYTLKFVFFFLFFLYSLFRISRITLEQNQLVDWLPLESIRSSLHKIKIKPKCPEMLAISEIFPFFSCVLCRQIFPQSKLFRKRRSYHLPFFQFWTMRTAYIICWSPLIYPQKHTILIEILSQIFCENLYNSIILQFFNKLPRKSKQFPK